MRLTAAIEGRLDEYMADEARGVASATKRAVTEVTTETKNLTRAHVASRLGRRAGFLVTSRVYDNGPIDKAGLIYSRWKRKSGVGSKPTDVLAVHAYGAVIEPRGSRFLYIPLVKGALSRRQRRIFQDGVGTKDVALIPFTDRHGNLAYVVREKSRRGVGRAIALLVQRVKVGSTLELDPIYRLAERSLVTRLVGYLDRPAA